MYYKYMNNIVKKVDEHNKLTKIKIVQVNYANQHIKAINSLISNIKSDKLINKNQLYKI